MCKHLYLYYLEYRDEIYSNITLKSVIVSEYSTASLIELTGLSYTTTYAFTGIYANDVTLGKIYE